MSDIFNPPKLPDPTEVECPDCGCQPGKACGSPAAQWNCGSRLWIVRMAMLVAGLVQPEPPRDSPSRDDYAAGWNDAVAAIVERIRGGR